MLIMFKRFRKQLLSEGKFGQYLIYAIGEIILVVVGILIALSIDDLVEDKKIAVKEQQILRQLYDEYSENLQQLTQKMMMRTQIIESSALILNYIDNPDMANEDSTIIHFGFTLRDPTFDPIKNDIIGTENLRVIKNDSLVRLLSNWTSDVYQVQEMELQYQKFRTEFGYPFVFKMGIMRDISHNIWKDGYTPMEALDSEIQVQKYIGKTKKPIDLNAILNDKQLEGYLANCITVNQVTNIQSTGLKNRIEEILRIIRKEMKQ